jgi:AcrR family transcriptional regulator
MQRMALGHRTKLQKSPEKAPELESTTRRRILDHAREAFNLRGVGAVGVRDLARALDLSPGNLSYHFPTKEALIAALVEESHATNNAVTTPFASASDFDFIALNRVIRDIMQRDVDHRWFTRDAAGLILSLPTLRKQHDTMQRAREQRVDRIIAHLIEADMLDAERTKEDQPLLRLQVLTQIFFWVPAALLAAPDGDPADRLDLHARSALALFLAYTTPAGKRQLLPLVSWKKKKG